MKIKMVIEKSVSAPQIFEYFPILNANFAPSKEEEVSHCWFPKVACIRLRDKREERRGEHLLV